MCSGRVADYFLIYLQAAERIEQLKPAQCPCVCMHTCHLSMFMGVCVCALFVFVRVFVHLRAVFWDVQLSGSATGGKCWPVSFLAPQPPSSHHNMELLTDLILSFSPALHSCSTPGDISRGSAALGEREGRHQKNFRLSGFKSNLLQFLGGCQPDD